MFLAKVAIRIMQLLEQRKKNLANAEDMLKRVKNIHHVLTMLQSVPKEDLADLKPITDGVAEVLSEIETHVEKAVADATGKSKLRRLLSVKDADALKLRLDEADNKLSKYLQLLSAAQGAKQLQQSARIEEQVARLTALSQQMFAFSLVAQGMQQQPRQPLPPLPMLAVPEVRSRSPSRRRGGRSASASAGAGRPRPLELETSDETEEGGSDSGSEASGRESDEAGDDDDAEGDGERDEDDGASTVGGPFSTDGDDTDYGPATSGRQRQRPVLTPAKGSPPGAGAAASSSRPTGPLRSARKPSAAGSDVAAAALGASAPRLPGGKQRSGRKRIGFKMGTKGGSSERPAGGGSAVSAAAIAESAAAAAAATAAAGPSFAQAHRVARYLEMAAHQFITGSFIGALALTAQSESSRVVMAMVVPLSPVVTMLIFAWWAGTLGATFSGGLRSFLHMCWTIYRLYATPPVFGMIILAFLGAIDALDTLNVYSQYLWGCFGGIVLFLLGHWIAEARAS
jgi:hypothetical protein